MTEDNMNLGIPVERSIEGSVPKGSTILVCGPSGTGKTAMSLQYVFNGITDQGEPAVFVSFLNDKDSLFSMAKKFDWHLKKSEKENMIQVILAYPSSRKFREWTSNFQGMNEEILESIDKMEAERVVLDGLDDLHRICKDENEFRSGLYFLIRELRKRECITLLNARSGYGVEDIVDGVVRLGFKKVDSGEKSRSMEIAKMNGIKHSLNEMLYKISGEGLEITSEVERKELPETMPESVETPGGEMGEKNDFLDSLLRHDIRNKAQVIMGYLELLKEESLTENGQEMIDKATKATKDCTELIDKITTLKKVIKEEVGKISLNPIIKNVISELEPRATKKGMKIEFSSCDCKVRAGSLIEELFSNLISNSIQHSGGNKVSISIHEADAMVRATVEDDGSGVPDEIKEQVFEKGFKMGESSGSGLGLYIVKKMAESYGGRAEIKDSELGGARFDIYLKKA